MCTQEYFVLYNHTVDLINKRIYPHILQVHLGKNGIFSRVKYFFNTSNRLAKLST
jgi:hypothetical protein